MDGVRLMRERRYDVNFSAATLGLDQFDRRVISFGPWCVRGRPDTRATEFL